MDRSALMGNIVDENLKITSGAGHPVRIGCLKKGVISNNSIIGGYHDQLKLHADVGSGGCPSAESLFFVVSDNIFINTRSAWSVSIAPQDAGSTEIVRDGVVERNLMRFSGPTHGWQGFMLTGTRIAARNNIVNLSGTADGSWGILVRDLGTSNSPVDTQIYNNTCYASDSGERVCVQVNVVAGSVTDTMIRNNLLYAPSANPKVPASCAGSNCVSSNNLLATTNPFLMSLPVVSADFQIASTSPAAKAGMSVPVLSDFGMRLRSLPPAVGAWDASGTALGVPGRPVLVP
jgi:hypothetical protein